MKTIVIIYGDDATHSEASCIKLNYYEMQNQRKKKIKPYNDPLTQPLHRFPQDVSIVFSIKVAGWFQSGLV